MTVYEPYDWQALRDQMVQEQLAARQISDRRVLAAMRTVPRHAFVLPDVRHLAYRDSPLPIGSDQTISQPFVVAYMSQLLALNGTEIVLEVGTGSGYQTAILCQLARQVYSIERHRALVEQAAARLDALDIHNVELLIGDGSQGLPDMAPFDAILITAVAPVLPITLRSQMADNGRLVLPVGNPQHQYLERVTRHGDTWQTERLLPVSFVPLIGRYGFGQHPSGPLEP